MKSITNLLLICVSLVFFIGCETTQKRVEPVNLGGVVGGVNQAVDRTLDIEKRVDNAYQKGLTAKSAEARALKDQVAHLKQDLEHTKKELRDASEDAQIKAEQANKAIATAERLKASAEKRNNWIIIAYYAVIPIFLAGYLIAKFFFVTASFSGPWGWALNILTKFLPLEVVVGLVCVIAGGICLKIILSIWSSVGWLARLFGFG